MAYIEFKLTIQTHPIGAQVWPRTPWSWRSCLLAHTSGGETEEGFQAAKSLEAQASSGSAECMLQLGEPWLNKRKLKISQGDVQTLWILWVLLGRCEGKQYQTMVNGAVLILVESDALPRA